MKISMLIDNERKNKYFIKEHGLSLYIEFMDKKILFDTGATELFADNAEYMGINIKEIDAVFLSHGHRDHTGGLWKFIELNSKAQIYMSKKALGEFYADIIFGKKNIGVDRHIIEKNLDRISFIENTSSIFENIYVVANFQRKYDMPKSNKRLLMKVDGQYCRDSFEHEIALVINNKGKYVVITGCSHNGVQNIIETVREELPSAQLQALIGGLHLMGFPRSIATGDTKSNIIKLGEKFDDLQIEKIFTCHCTGKKACNILKKVLGNKIEYLSTGEVIEL